MSDQKPVEYHKTVRLTESDWATICTALTVTILNLDLDDPAAQTVNSDLRGTLMRVQRALGLRVQSPEELERERQRRCGRKS